MSDEMISCTDPISDPTPAAAPESSATPAAQQEASMPVARAGAKAPDFVGNAYVEGGFKQVKLSDYAGKWTVLCFYPGDFTFV